MPDEAEVDRLLETLLESEQTPEEACADHPELLTMVRKRLSQFAQLKEELQTIFPSLNAESQSLRHHQIGGLPTIAGYEIESTLGRGGMGIVYKARQLNLNRPVALKMLLAGVCATPDELSRFIREAHAIAVLRHTNIVQIYDIGDCDGRAYFTMELFDGGTLTKKLDGKPQPAKAAAELISILAKTIDFAYQSGVVHRDLKPSNILLTAQGVAKIGDFGLARNTNSHHDLTLSGARLGTPSYMAPEQALGKHDAVSPATDTYALGAILYEMLTGGPPFLAESAIETQRLLIKEDPIPPSKLNPKVPRDLQTICLRCLQKDPDRRHESAAQLAADLNRFIRGEPILSRPIGITERLTKWIGRRPAIATGIAALLLISAVLLAGTMWMQLQRQQRQTAAENDLRNMIGLENAGHWKEAAASLSQAQARLGWGNFGNLRHEIDHARTDLVLVMKLDQIRLSRITGGVLDYYRAQACSHYQVAFRDAGLATAGEAPARIAPRIIASPVRLALVAALDDWAVSTTEVNQRDWLLQVSQRVAPNQAWRAKLNDHAGWKNRKNLEQLAMAIPITTDSITLLLGISERNKAIDRDVPQYLREIQKQNPANFWTNLTLGDALLQQEPVAAEGYYRAALATRPEAAVGYDAVGDALRLQHRYTEALDYYQKALNVDPTYPRAVSNLAGALAGLGRSQEAIDNYRRALQLDPNYIWAHYGLANTLRDTDQFAAAAAEYRLFIAARSVNADAVNSLRRVLIRQGQIQQVWTDWQQTLKSNPQKYSAWSGAAELALYLNDQASYAKIRSELLQQFSGDTPDAAEVARTCLLSVGSSQEIDQATAIALRVQQQSSAQNSGLARFDSGLAQYRLRQWDAAVASLSSNTDRSFDTCSRLVMAMALMKKGEPTEARQVFADAISSFNWVTQNADRRDAWICHILRREAEKAMTPSAQKP